MPLPGLRNAGTCAEPACVAPVRLPGDDLDPKGLSRFGGRERRRVRLHRAIGEVERHARRTDPNLRLHAYVLSVTPAAQIDAGARSAADWKRDGVYFLNERDCLQEVIAHALRRSPARRPAVW